MNIHNYITARLLALTNQRLKLLHCITVSCLLRFPYEGNIREIYRGAVVGCGGWQGGGCGGSGGGGWRRREVASMKEFLLLRVGYRGSTVRFGFAG